MRRRFTLGGYLMVDALVAVMIAAVAAGLALRLIAWAVHQVKVAEAVTQRTRVLELLYERARVSPPVDLDKPQAGQIGQVHWAREAMLYQRSGQFPALRRVLFRLRVPDLEGGRERIVEAIVWPVGADNGR